MTIGELIHTRRKELGLTLEEVGVAVGVSKSTVKKWETGFISNMKRDKIALLSEVLHVSPSVFIVDETECALNECFTQPNKKEAPDLTELLNMCEGLNDNDIKKVIEYAQLLKKANQ